MPFLIRTPYGRAVVCVLLAVAACVAGPAWAQDPAHAPNSDPTYQALRNLTLSGESVAVRNLELKRDAGTFYLNLGTVCFLAPVNGKVTGAVYAGDGKFVLNPPIEGERKSLYLLSKESNFSEQFLNLVLRFTDSTYEEIKKAGHPTTAGCEAGVLKDSQNATGHRLRYNLEARILEDLLGEEPGRLFVAFVQGQRYSDKMVYAIDPHGVPEFADHLFGGFPIAIPLAPEEVVLMTYEDRKHGYWSAFHLSPEYKSGEASGTQKNAVLEISHQQLDTTIEKSGQLECKATTSFVSRINGLRVAPFNLYGTLRVQSVTGDSGQQLSFIQEDKNEDFQLFVILPNAFATGEKLSITTVYGGKGAVSNEGGGNYFLIAPARKNWYPSSPGASFGAYASYDMTFHIPKGMKVAATGTLIRESDDGGQNLSVWKSETQQEVAGFSFGRFKLEEAKLAKPEYEVRSFANEDSPDWLQNLKNTNIYAGDPTQRYLEATFRSMDTALLNKKALAEGELALQLYTDFFGPSLFKHLEITQQTACNFGQSWPGLVGIPICYYLDPIVRSQLRPNSPDLGYWKIVTPHEIAHQWWGHTVGFSSYRDQWMSEGFADMSGSLYLTMVQKDPKKFITFWNEERKLLLDRDAQGFRAIDAAPVTMGYRADNSRTGDNTTRSLIYPKGAYILHMIRMMMYDNRTGDQHFKEMMQDFVKTYSGKAATTEDFRAMVERHMTPEMDLEGNHRMDWFFNEYVYGTQLPSYTSDASFDIGADGDVVMSVKVKQSNVDDKFRMLVPLYLELADGNMFFLGRARAVGNNSIEEKVPLKGMKTKPRRAVLNYYDDVLAAPN